MSGVKIEAYIEAPPVGASFISTWPGRSGNQVALVAEGTADQAGLKEVAQALHAKMGLVGQYALDAWLECEGQVVVYCSLGYLDHTEVLRRLGVSA